MERRDQLSKASFEAASSGHRVRGERLPAFERLRVAAREETNLLFNNLMCQMKVDFLKAVYHELSARKASGLDGMTKQRYGANLEANLKELETRLHQGSYQPAPSRQTFIPKGDGDVRPIAISNFEDKIVQGAVARILETLYEPIFIGSSLGFRPRRGCQQAVRKVYHLLKKGERPYLVDGDIEKFFDSMDHQRLMAFLRRRITDRRFLRLVWRLLRNGMVKQEGEVEENQEGSPQGSVVSPLLANIYLHYVLDTWFEEEGTSHHQTMVRYADDTLFCFKDRVKAQDFLKRLQDRLRENQLQLNQDKTRIVDFRRGGQEVFDFLGFTFYWGKDRRQKTLLKLKTKAKRLRESIQAFKTWIQTNRNRHKLKALWKMAAQKLRGHYAYFGVTFNQKVYFYYLICIRLLYKWLNRRSQKRSMSWEQFHHRLRLKPLPKPWGCKSLNLTQGVFDFAV